MKRRHFLQLGLAGLATTTLSGCFGCWPNRCRHGDYRTRYYHGKNTKVKLYYNKNTIVVLSPDFTIVKHYELPEVWWNLPESLIKKAYLRFDIEDGYDQAFDEVSFETRTNLTVCLYWKDSMLSKSEIRLLDSLIKQQGNTINDFFDFALAHEMRLDRVEIPSGRGLEFLFGGEDEKDFKIAPALRYTEGDVYYKHTQLSDPVRTNEEVRRAYLYAPTRYPSGFFDNARDVVYNPNLSDEYVEVPPTPKWSNLPSPVKIDERGRVSLDGKALTLLDLPSPFVSEPKTTQTS